jgi:hypothetical protein
VILAVATVLDGRPAEVSAAELLERAELSAANPFAAGLKSFHLKGKSGGRLPFGKVQVDGARQADGAVEQWFSAPDRSRSETRSKAADGTTVVSGMVTDGKTRSGSGSV